MKKFLFPLIMLGSLLVFQSADAAKPVWIQKWGGASGECIRDMVVSDAGDTYFISCSNKLFKYNSSGNSVWSSSGITIINNVSSPKKIYFNPQKTFLYILGSRVPGLRVAQYDLAGNFIQAYDTVPPATEPDGSYFQFLSPSDVTIKTNGDVALIGTAFHFGTKEFIRTVIGKFTAGNQTNDWQSILPNNESITSYSGKALTFDSTGNYIYATAGQGTGAFLNLAIWKIASSSPTALWESVRSLGSFVAAPIYYSFSSSGNGNHMFAGGTSSIYIGIPAGVASGRLGIVLMKTHENGNTLVPDWINIINPEEGLYSSGYYDPGAGSTMLMTSSSVFSVGAAVDILGTSTVDGVMSRLSLSGSEISSSSPSLLERTYYDNGSSDKFHAIGIDSAGYIYAGGYTYQNGNADYLLVKYGPGCTGNSGFSSWLDADSLSGGVHQIRAGHFSQLRSLIDNLRIDAGLSAYSWRDGSLSSGQAVKKNHIDDLRTAISEVYTTCGRATPSWTDSAITAGVTPVKATHINEIRQAVRIAP